MSLDHSDRNKPNSHVATCLETHTISAQSSHHCGFENKHNYIIVVTSISIRDLLWHTVDLVLVHSELYHSPSDAIITHCAVTSLNGSAHLKVCTLFWIPSLGHAHTETTCWLNTVHNSPWLCHPNAQLAQDLWYCCSSYSHGRTAVKSSAGTRRCPGQCQE